MKRIAAFQFANTYARREAGYMAVANVYVSPFFGWMDPVDPGANRGVRTPHLEGYVVERAPAVFAMGLPNGDYRVAITAYAKDRAHGPFCVKANGEFVLRDVVAPVGTAQRWVFPCRAENRRLSIEFRPHMGKDFLVNALEVFAKRDVKWVPLFKTASRVTHPTRAELHRWAADDPRKALRRMCDWFVARCPANGYLGDIWNGGFRATYSLAMPVRALLAGYDLLGDRKYLATAVRALDAFASEQLPNGGWEGEFHGKPVTHWSREDLDGVLKRGRIPMSDIGSPTTALAVASQYVPAGRRKRYIKAVRRFCDDWASQFQLKSGAFTDGQWEGFEGKVYSCATAIQAALHSLAYRVTGEPAYRRTAQKAIEFLLNDWRPDGRMLGRAPHWHFRNGDPFVLEPLHFGDQWYYDEGFITTWHHAPEGAFRNRVRRALRNRVHGSAGLLKALDGNVWWPIQDIWNNAKSIGMVQTLLFAHRFGISSPRLESALPELERFICTPHFAERLGIMADDAERPAILHGLMTWSGMGNEATGFAGMSLAESFKPGVLYLAQEKRSGAD